MAPRPPSAPCALSRTWRHLALHAVGADLKVLGAALLATEARRRRKLVLRERRALSFKRSCSGAAAGTATGRKWLGIRVRALERELSSLAKGVERYKAAAFRSGKKLLQAAPSGLLAVKQ